MSLTLCITTPEGIVLAADSRQTYQNVVGAKRVGSDSATKIYKVDGRIGVTVAGPAFLIDPSDPQVGPKGIGTFVQDILSTVAKNDTVESVAKRLSVALEKIYDPTKILDAMEPEIEKQLHMNNGKIVKKERLKNNIGIAIDWIDRNGVTQKAMGEVMPISLIVAGYDNQEKGKKVLNCFMSHIPGELKPIRQHGTQNQYGASWTGQSDVVQRVILGFDPRIMNVPLMQAVVKTQGLDNVNNSLHSLEYIINWSAMTIYDAVAFAKLMVETTSAIQKFSDGIKLMPGDMPGVGGPIDVAIISPKNGFLWHAKKQLELLEEPKI